LDRRVVHRLTWCNLRELSMTLSTLHNKVQQQCYTACNNYDINWNKQKHCDASEYQLAQETCANINLPYLKWRKYWESHENRHLVGRHWALPYVRSIHASFIGALGGCYCLTKLYNQCSFHRHALPGGFRGLPRGNVRFSCSVTACQQDGRKDTSAVCCSLGPVFTVNKNNVIRDVENV